MTFENITKKAVLNAAGRLVDPGSKITMPVEYYANHKDFIDAYVSDKKAKIGGTEEYKEFLKNDGKKPKKEEEKVDLMAEVQEEEKLEVKPEPKKEEPKKEEPKAEEVTEEEKPAPKKASRRRRTTKTEDK